MTSMRFFLFKQLLNCILHIFFILFYKYFMFFSFFIQKLYKKLIVSSLNIFIFALGKCCSKLKHLPAP